MKLRVLMQEQTMGNCASKITKDSLDCLNVRKAMLEHELVDYSNCKRDVRASRRDILKRDNHLTIYEWLEKHVAIMGREVLLDDKRCRNCIETNRSKRYSSSVTYFN